MKGMININININLLEMELSKLKFPAIGVLFSFLSIQPWMVASLPSAAGIGVEIRGIVLDLIKIESIGIVRGLYLPLAISIGGYMAYSISTDFNTGLAQTFLSYPISRRSYAYSKLLLALILSLIPSSFSSIMRAAFLVEEDLSLVPVPIILLLIAMYAFPIASWALLISILFRKSLFASLGSSIFPWIVIRAISLEKKFKFGVLLPSGYADAFMLGNYIPPILSSLSITLFCLAFIEIVISRLEVL